MAAAPTSATTAGTAVAAAAPPAWTPAEGAPAVPTEQRTWLVYGGKTGWIGQHLIRLLVEQGEDPSRVIAAEARLEYRDQIEAELDRVQPTHVLLAAGITGRPNVDWCESHREETLRVNVSGTLTLVECCQQRGVHITNMSSGCIYQYEDEGAGRHTLGSGVGYTEADAPNFDGSFYSLTKVSTERLLVRTYGGDGSGVAQGSTGTGFRVLTLRLRMPISDDLHGRSFLTKISRYERVVNIANSVTILADLLPVALDMARRRRGGVYNFTNPGTISHNQLLDLYRQYIDPAFVYTNFSLDEQARILKAPRSNNELDVAKLLAEYPHLPHAHAASVAMFQRMQAAGVKPPAKA